MPVGRQPLPSGPSTSRLWPSGGVHRWPSGGTSSAQTHPRGHLVYAARADTAKALLAHAEPVAEALGEHIFGHFVRNKRAEWDDYRAQVTPYELDRYLPTL